MVFRLRVRARVRFRVSSNAVFASSARSASRAHRLDTVGLGLTGPIRDCPPALDDDPGAPCAPLGDLYVSDIEDPSSLRPPPVGATSAARERCRKEVSGTFHWLSAPSASPGAVRTYGPTLRAFAPKVSTKLRIRKYRACAYCRQNPKACSTPSSRPRYCWAPSVRHQARGSLP